MAEVKKTINACQGWGCHEHCMLETHTVDGRIVRTQYLPLPGPKPDNAICAKGILAGKIPYVEDRILHPLKRTGKRGEGKFERISWDQALDEIGAKLSELREKYGPKSILVNAFWCGYPGDYRSLQNSLIFRFVHSFGASLMEYTDVDDAPSYLDASEYGVYSTTDNKALTQTNNYLIIWGGNPLGFTRPGVTSKMILDAQERGAKFVHISNMFDATSAKADQWVPVKSGTDAALALAMAGLIVKWGEVDEQYLIDKTVGPFLVREDNGKFLRAADILDAEGAPEIDPESIANYVYIDAASNKPLTIGTGAPFSAPPVLDATTTIAGIVCKSAYVLLKESLAEWTPERQEPITGVSAQTCEQIAKEYLDARPSTIYIYYGFRYRNGGQTARAIHLLALLSGNLGLKGGRMILSGSADTNIKYTALNDPPIYFPDGMAGIKGDHVALVPVLDSFDDPDVQQYKAWLNPMGNPLLNWPNKDLWENKLLPNLELFVSWEIRMSDTARYADYVLPETTIFEREDILIGPDDCIALNQPAIEPLGESKNPTEIWNELAKRLGLEHHWDKSTEDWLRIKLGEAVGDVPAVEISAELEEATHQDSSNQFGGDYHEGISYDMLKAEPRALHLNVPMEFNDYYDNPEIGTFSGRIEFYVESLADTTGALASFEPAIIHDHPLKEQYPLHFFPGRHKYFMQGQFTNIPELRILADSQFGCALNPVTANERGLKNGDVVEVFNQRGSMFVPLHVRRFVPPGMAHVWYSYPWSTYTQGDPPQALATPENTRETESDISKTFGLYYYNLGASQGVPATLLAMNGLTTNEVFWDSLCEVRKADVVAGDVLSAFKTTFEAAHASKNDAKEGN